jgi:hypothetical protein
MRKHLRRMLPSPAMTVAIVSLLVGLSGTTYAATGGNFILGQTNTANKQTLLTSSAHAPFTVNSSTKVDGLNSDQLDGLDSSAFLPSNGKAADSDLLDGIDSTGFYAAGSKVADSSHADNANHAASADNASHAASADTLGSFGADDFIFGPGRAFRISAALSPGTFPYIGGPMGGFIRVAYMCPGALTSNGSLWFENDSGADANVFIDGGADNPSYFQIPAGNGTTVPASPTGDGWVIQAEGNPGIITIDINTVHRSSDCWLQGEWLLSG